MVTRQVVLSTFLILRKLSQGGNLEIRKATQNLSNVSSGSWRVFTVLKLATVSNRKNEE
jgi:hypothetical protein